MSGSLFDFDTYIPTNSQNNLIQELPPIIENNLDEKTKLKHEKDIQNNRNHLNSLKGKTSSEWREYATKCMVEIMDNKSKI